MSDLTTLLREARAHVVATRERTNTRTVHEGAVDLLARIDQALSDLDKTAPELRAGSGPDMDEDGPIVWP